jgi:hypothetical protein
MALPGNGYEVRIAVLSHDRVHPAQGDREEQSVEVQVRPGSI